MKQGKGFNPSPFIYGTRFLLVFGFDYATKSPFTRLAIRNANGIATANATISHIEPNQFETEVATSAKS